MLFVSSGTEMELQSDLKAKRDLDVRDPNIVGFLYLNFTVPVLFFQSRHKVAIAEYQHEKH